MTCFDIFVNKLIIMEIKELISYYVNTESGILEISFRTIEDDDEVLRNDSIVYSVVEDYGFQLETETLDFFDDEFEDYEEEGDKIELDEDELVIFLNEYYTINEHLIPKAELY